jgi:hypothetical protein
MIINFWIKFELCDDFEIFSFGLEYSEHSDRIKIQKKLNIEFNTQISRIILFVLTLLRLKSFEFIIFVSVPSRLTLLYLDIFSLSYYYN